MYRGDPVDGPSGPEGSPFAPPVKRSITIAGHQTAISLEPIFWDALRLRAAQQQLPLNALVARIDAARLAASQTPNLASAIRSWLFQQQMCDKDNNQSQ